MRFHRPNKPRLNRFVKQVLTASTIATLAGCVHYDFSALKSSNTPRLSLDQRTCCHSVLSLKPEPLIPNQTITAEINGNDAVLEFSSGKSYTQAFALPEVQSEYYLQVDSIVDIRGLDLIPRAIYPMVTLLDANLNTIATFDNEPLKLHKPVFGIKHISIILPIEAASNAKYALIHTSESRKKQGLTTVPPIEVVNIRGFDSISYAESSPSKNKIQFAETGGFKVITHIKKT